MSSPDLIGGSHHKEFRIPNIDPPVKLWDDIVGNLEFPIEIPQRGWGMTGNLEFLEIASSHSLLAITRILEFLDCFAFSKHRNDAGNFRIPFEIFKKNTP